MSRQLRQIPEIAAAFRSAGLRCTPQRYAVIDYLYRGKEHATADQIALAINRSGSAASRATVYNALHALLEAGLVREVGGGAAARYDASVQRHHHFACDSCGALDDIPWFEVPSPVQALGHRLVSGYEILFRGLCPACREQNESRRNT
jgi:Fur family transcriptional regulator, peroxide stress response regulator